jgi:hypothetical protein
LEEKTQAIRVFPIVNRKSSIGNSLATNHSSLTQRRAGDGETVTVVGARLPG